MMREMTREDAFEIWLPIIKMGVKSIPECSEALDMAIKALKQESCDDCIRREDALMALTGEYKDSPIEILPKAIKRINALPPVTPAEKVGQWEWEHESFTKNWGNWHCSKCRKIITVCETDWAKINKPIYKYCPDCGAKMQEVEE